MNIAIESEERKEELVGKSNFTFGLETYEFALDVEIFESKKRSKSMDIVRHDSLNVLQSVKRARSIFILN